MDRTVVKKTALSDQDEAFCLSLSLDDRLRVLEDLNRQGRIMAGYPENAPMDRKVVRAAWYRLALGITARPIIKGVQNADPEKLAFTLGNVTYNPVHYYQVVIRYRDAQ